MLKKQETGLFLKECEFLHKTDNLLHLREQYFLPENKVYLCGNSLGLQPVSTPQFIDNELKIWAKMGVEGHFESSINWYNYHEYIDKILSKLCGALQTEVCCANSLTANIHMLFSTFFKPTSRKKKILIENPVFSSDYYAIASQIEFHGFPIADTLIEIAPESGFYTIDTNDILNAIQHHKDELAMIWLSGVNFYSGQKLDMEAISKEANKFGIIIGLDLAHAIGNVELHLHDWGVDIAAWCSYKYLNSGPGGVGGYYIHEKHHNTFPTLRGWWGYKESERFEMNKNFEPEKGAKAWQWSNLPIVSMATHRAALELFDKIPFDILREKSELMTSLLYNALKTIFENKKNAIIIITPESPYERGCQLSIMARNKGYQLYKTLEAQGIVCDYRKPDVIRIAPVPMYNTFEDIKKTIIAFETATDEIFK